MESEVFEMTMIPTQIVVPQGMLPYLEQTDEKATFERNAMILYPFIRSMTISHGRAAELLGVHKLDLIEFYNKLGIPYLNQTAEDLNEELDGFRRLKEIAQ